DSSIPNIEDVVPALDEAVHPESAATFESIDLQEDERDEPIDDHPLLQVNSPLADFVSGLPNGVAERKNRTLIKAARTMLVDSKLPTTFWAEAVNTACYVLNRALVIKPHNKTPNELIRGRPLLIDFMKPFGCPVTILNTKDYLGKFDEKVDEGFFVGYSVVSKAMRVFNKRTKIVKETLNIRFLRNAPNVKGNRRDWLFDIDSLTISMDYVLVVAGFQTNGIARTKDNIVAGQDEKKKEHEQEYIIIPICTTDPLISQGPKDSADDQVTRSEFEGILQQERKTEHINITNSFNTVSSHANTVGPSFVNTASPSPINAAGTPANTNSFEEHSFEQFSPFKNAFSIPHVPIVTPIDDTGIFDNAYDDEAVEEEVDINNVDSSYIIPDAPLTKFLKDHLKDQGHTQEEGIDYDEVFTPIARIEAIKLFLAYASFKDFVVYQMNVKSAFLYGKIKEEVYVCQPPSFEDPDFPDKVYKVEKALYRLHQALRAWKEMSTEFESLMHDKF
nr:retrovirus-related Pol polyprotein from transposon TNT 1-94 [Tanacetum cinerariifolium]